MRIVKILKRKDNSTSTYVDISFEKSDKVTKYTYFLNKTNRIITIPIKTGQALYETLARASSSKQGHKPQ